MTKFFRYMTMICGMIAFFSMANYFCYQSAMKRMVSMQKDYEKRLGDQVHDYVEEDMDTQMESVRQEMHKSVAANAAKENMLTNSTIFQIQNYDALTGTTTTEYQALPEQLNGYTIDKTEKYCQEYMDHMTAQEFLDGLQSVRLVSFSAERLVVQKNYDLSKVKFRYYLIASEGEVVVYYGDMKTIYEKTGIQTDSLRKEDQRRLKNGIKVKDEEELFGILENYSS